jgi:RimJ/RimL family protein N-acetyltransferase
MSSNSKLPSALALLELQLRTGFTFDAAGRMVAVNEYGFPAAPRFFLGRTAEGNVLALRHDLPQDLAAELQSLAAREPTPGTLREPARCEDAVLAALARHAPITKPYRGPEYAILGDIPAAGEAAMLITPTNATLLHPGFATLVPELAERQPCLGTVVDGRAVSVCFSSRNGPRAAAAGVETIAEYRGHGYATAATIEWARAVRAEGRQPLYGTTWDNVASQAIARHLNATMFSESWHIS